MEILVGYTGFVGSNLNLQRKFDKTFNSKNIENAFGTNPDLCVYAGVRAEKFLANKDPEKDLETIKDTIENIKKINPKKLVLISTIDVYKNPVKVDENSVIDTENLHAYGLNRYYLENWVAENIEDYHIIRLPGLFGRNLKKNFIYDLINLIPSMLNEAKYKELAEKSELISKHYISQENGFYKCAYKTEEERQLLKEAFDNIGFSALNFTDSRGVFQFYNLAYLWSHIEIAIKNNIRLLNLAVEPVSVSEIYKKVRGTDFINEVASVIPKYDFNTIYANNFGGKNGYIFDKQQSINDIYNFVKDGMN